ncbi:VOC family protein [Saccharopolyspora sp. NPDC002686]|uniref:VOC family protein n=1 Tax=Saccharopolyspora sp. NPDC002686 TaxID=3154541 RepID=UPI0033320FE8
MAIQPIVITPDLDRLQSFYQELLGAREIVRMPEDGPTFFIDLDIDGDRLGLVNNGDVEVGEPGRVLLSFSVDDVDELLERVEPAGGQVMGPANDMPWGQRVAHIKDPDGNAVNLTQQI